MKTTAITASLDAKLLANADRYFTADLPTLVDELVQNARRAGATEIRFTREKNALLVEDNGPGLAAERAPVLLRLGGSDNSAEVESRESAAGMGFFALARYGVTVRSQNWEMTVTPEAFRGETTATLTEGHPHVAGMAIQIHDLSSAKRFVDVIDGTLFRKATRYSGLRMQITGCTAVQGWYEPECFLAQHDDKSDHTASRTVHGVTVKVCRGRPESEGMRINFFGKVIRASRPLPSDRESLAYITGRDGQKAVRSRDVTTAVLVDVHDTSVLTLQLPQRSTVIEDEGFAKICAVARELMQDILLTPGVSNGVPMDSPLREGRGAGIVPPSVALPSAFCTDNTYVETRYVSDGDGLINTAGERLPLSDVLAADLSDYFISLLDTERAGTVIGEHGIFEKENILEAFGPGRCKIIEAIGLSAKIDGEEIESEEAFEPSDDAEVIDHHLAGDQAFGGMPSRFVEDLALELHIHGPAGNEVLTVPVPAIYFCDHGMVESPTVIMLNDTGKDHVDTIMMTGIRWFNEKYDGDYETREDYISGLYSALIAKLSGISNAAFLADLKEEIDRLARRHFGMTGDVVQELTITVQANLKPTGLEIKESDITVVPLAA